MVQDLPGPLRCCPNKPKNLPVQLSFKLFLSLVSQRQRAACALAYTCVYKHTHVCASIHMCVQAYTCVCKHTHVCTSIHMCVQAYTGRRVVCVDDTRRQQALAPDGARVVEARCNARLQTHLHVAVH
jgi:hypothetical protein